MNEFDRRTARRLVRQLSSLLRSRSHHHCSSNRNGCNGAQKQLDAFWPLPGAAAAAAFTVLVGCSGRAALADKREAIGGCSLCRECSGHGHGPGRCCLPAMRRPRDAPRILATPVPLTGADGMKSGGLRRRSVPRGMQGRAARGARAGGRHRRAIAGGGHRGGEHRRTIVEAAIAASRPRGGMAGRVNLWCTAAQGDEERSTAGDAHEAAQAFPSRQPTIDWGPPSSPPRQRRYPARAQAGLRPPPLLGGAEAPPPWGRRLPPVPCICRCMGRRLLALHQWARRSARHATLPCKGVAVPLRHPVETGSQYSRSRRSAARPVVAPCPASVALPRAPPPAAPTAGRRKLCSPAPLPAGCALPCPLAWRTYPGRARHTRPASVALRLLAGTTRRKPSRPVAARRWVRLAAACVPGMGAHTAVNRLVLAERDPWETRPCDALYSAQPQSGFAYNGVNVVRTEKKGMDATWGMQTDKTVSRHACPAHAPCPVGGPGRQTLPGWRVLRVQAAPAACRHQKLHTMAST